MLNEDYTIVRTKDGSDTVYSKQFSAHYHSLHGAIQESEHVFIKNGLYYALDKFRELNILETGLGTCLNAALTVFHAGDKKINYIGLEKYPLPQSVIQSLNFKEYSDLAKDIDRLPWECETKLSSQFTFTKKKCEIQSFNFPHNFELVYFDAFAPGTQPELWQSHVLSSIYDHLVTGGILVTFCAQGAFKRTLKSIGFTVETLIGPPGKREMIRAVKSF